MGGARNLCLDGALRKPPQKTDTRFQGFGAVRNPPFPRRFASRTLQACEGRGNRADYRVGGARNLCLDGALRKPPQKTDTRFQGFGAVRNPPFPPRFASRTLQACEGTCHPRREHRQPIIENCSCYFPPIASDWRAKVRLCWQVALVGDAGGGSVGGGRGEHCILSVTMIRPVFALIATQRAFMS